jgi:hypothetical protein
MNDTNLSALEQNKIEDGITISINSTNTDAPGNTVLPLSDFLRRFETPKQRSAVMDAVHASLRSARN